jgi:hypothetical protein
VGGVHHVVPSLATDCLIHPTEGTMNLADAIAAEPPKRKGPLCGVAALWLSFDDDDRKVFESLLDEVVARDRSVASVVRILNRAGHQFTQNRMSHHMRAECSCPRDPDGRVFWPTP